MYTSLQIFGITLIFAIACVLGSNSDVKDSGRGAHSDRGGLWFGPRLGKRSLSAEDSKQAFLKVLEAADALRYYDEFPRELQVNDPETSVTKKVIFTPKLGRSIMDQEEVEREEFTPRLGRQAIEDLPATPTDQQFYAVDQNTIENRAKYFSPRLGRAMNFSPRLGRRLAYGMFPQKIRLVRSINKTHST
ncbi:unnamed protein product [Chrysodeixis includens]|uniref:PBAN-type neuropeptides n=1 Tax=Chrysodeixis includens TaxID=689277 RepID=A0A9P0FYI9_CHRIL|nr:unnamed protein product [Chrysodeixis includens]